MLRARLVAATLLVANCRPVDRSETTTIVDSASVRLTTVHVAPADLVEWSIAEAPELTITAAAAGDSTAFEHVGSVNWLSDGRIVVADVAASRLLLFDASGTLIRSLGRNG